MGSKNPLLIELLVSNSELINFLEIEEQSGEKDKQSKGSPEGQKEKLQKLVEEMEKKFVKRDHALDDSEKSKAHKLRKVQLALKKQKEKQQILMEQKLKEEEEKLFYEKQYKNQQEQFEENARVLQEIRVRYKGALQEIKDLEEEHQNEHADLINTVREQQHELLLIKGMLKMLLKDNEIEKVRHRSSFEEESQQWNIPYFYLQAKNVAFPKLGKNQARDLVENEKENRELQFGQKSSVEDSSRNSSNTF